MHYLAIAAGTASVLIWLYLLFLNGDFWRVMSNCSTWNNWAKPLSRHVAEENIGGSIPKWERPPVAVIVPARNEAAVIADSVSSLLKQDYDGRVHLFVVDDDSSDRTAQLAREAAARAGRSTALTLVTGQALPAGWTGKLWAVRQGMEAARALEPRFLLLTDADVVHASDSLSTLVTIAESGGYDLTSFMVRLDCESAAERWLIPAFVFFFFMLYPPRWIADPRRANAGAAGGCMLVRPEALDRAGGIDTIRGEVIDDCALARVIKLGKNPVPPAGQGQDRANHGLERGTRGRVWLGLAKETRSVREYGSAVEIGRMISRTAFSQLRHSAVLLALTMLGLAITFVVPVLLVVFPLNNPGQMWGALLGAVAWALMTLAYLPTVRYYRISPLWALTLPLAAVFYLGATVWSAVKYWSGRGGGWKGRAQDIQH